MENDSSLRRILKQAKNGPKIWLLNFSSGVILLTIRSIETLERAHKYFIDRKIQNRKVDNDFIRMIQKKPGESNYAFDGKIPNFDVGNDLT